MGCVHSVVAFSLKLWRRLKWRTNGHGDMQTDTATCSMKRDNSYRSYLSHEDLVPELGVTTPDGCYYPLVTNKPLTPVKAAVNTQTTDTLEMTSLEELEIEGLLEQHPGVVDVTVRDTSAVSTHGRRVTAFVVLKPAYRSMRTDQLAQYVRWNLPSPLLFQVRVIVVDRIPWSCKFHELAANHPEEHTSFL